MQPASTPFSQQLQAASPSLGPCLRLLQAALHTSVAATSDSTSTHAGRSMLPGCAWLLLLLPYWPGSGSVSSALQGVGHKRGCCSGLRGSASVQSACVGVLVLNDAIWT